MLQGQCKTLKFVDSIMAFSHVTKHALKGLRVKVTNKYVEVIINFITVMINSFSSSLLCKCLVQQPHTLYPEVFLVWLSCIMHMNPWRKLS